MGSPKNEWNAARRRKSRTRQEATVHTQSENFWNRRETHNQYPKYTNSCRAKSNCAIPAVQDQ